MEKLKGIVLYNMQLDGNLNGVYTNNHPRTGGILTETARLISSNGGFRSDGIMEYECFWFDQVTGPVNAHLTFRIVDGMINSEWIITGETSPAFVGYGFQMNEHQIAISYWEA